MGVVTDDYGHFFEGAEKCLEIWFDSKNCKDSDLRVIPRSALDKLLNIVKAEIISFKKNDSIDAYVLSESSMFISKNRFIIKTCGSTTLLRCVPPFLALVKQHTDFENILDVFYSRKNFLRPELQDQPHSNFLEEVNYLDNLFEDGAAYCMGRLNCDYWFLYTLYPLEVERSVDIADQTLEIIMQNLDPNVMKIFTRNVCSSAKEATQRSGIDKLVPGMIIDDFLFEPCGYSMNGIIKGGYYVTIHITPEPDFSYVSFETNVPQSSYFDIIARVLKTFNPGKFTITLCANEDSIASDGLKDSRYQSFAGFLKKDMQFCSFKNYDLIYGLFAKAPS